MGLNTDLNLNFALYKTEFGHLRIGYDRGKVIELSVSAASCPNNIGNPNSLSDFTFTQIEQYLAGKRRLFDVPICLRGTSFQLSVWQALMQIPYGQTRTYGEIANIIGNPRASRAVGMANNKNPICIIVPCHRVIGANGGLVGYAAGLDIKKMLLNIECQSMW